MLKKFIAGLVICIALLGFSGYAVYKIFYPGERNVKKDVMPEEEKFVAVGRTSIAVMGVDQRSEDDGRADTIFVIMYEPKTKNVSMLSVPRDTRVRISENRWDKINHSFNYGGAEKVVSTLENFLGIQIDYYVQLDFHGFERMVDAIGGLELDVENRMYYEDPYDGEDGFIIDLYPGMQKLDGKKAIQYVRYRDEEGDIGRVKRQQHFINTAYEKMLTPEMFKKLPELAKVAYESVSTNMSIVDMISVAKTLHENARTGINSYSVPGTPVDIEEINYWAPDVLTVRSEVATILDLNERERDKFMVTAARVASLYESSLPDYDSDEESDEKDTEEDKKGTDGKAVANKDGEKRTNNKSDDKKKQPDNKQDDTKKPVEKQQTPQQTTKQLRASVINCSGDASGGKKMERLLESNGVRVVSIFEGNAQNGSSVVSNTQDSWVVSKLAALPFRYSLRINKDGAESIEAVVYVGKDFVQNN